MPDSYPILKKILLGCSYYATQASLEFDTLLSHSSEPWFYWLQVYTLTLWRVTAPGSDPVWWRGVPSVRK